jgi:hypothetical protein
LAGIGKDMVWAVGLASGMPSEFYFIIYIQHGTFSRHMSPFAHNRFNRNYNTTQIACRITTTHMFNSRYIMTESQASREQKKQQPANAGHQLSIINPTTSVQRDLELLEWYRLKRIQDN